MYLVWLRVAAVLYAVASLSALPAVLYAFPRWRKVCLPAAGLAFLFHLVSVTEMLGLAHRYFPVGYGEVESLLGLAIAALFLAITRIYGTLSFGIFALPASFLLVFVPALGADRYTFPSAGVRVGWLVVHIAFLLAAYASLAFSMVASFLYLVQERRLKSPQFAMAGNLTSQSPTSQNRDVGHPRSYPRPMLKMDLLPPLDTLERIAHATLLFGFPCMTLGLLVGSLLAQESVGAAYFFDPKVLLSFAMWMLYVVLLHIRRSAGLRGRRAAYLSSAVFVVMLIVWAANQFSQVHRYPAL
jgi:ABC-type transport system involved in cytochrome c biogenesis permease subunit